MKLSIDTEARTRSPRSEATADHLPLYSPEAFSALSQAWVKVGWGVKYTYGFTWMGRPMIQLPDDMIRIQEVIYRVRPDVLIETGVAHGGSLVFYASLFKAMGQGRVVGVDIEIRPHNRKAIEAHELSPYITLIEGSSTDPAVVAGGRAGQAGRKGHGGPRFEPHEEARGRRARSLRAAGARRARTSWRPTAS